MRTITPAPRIITPAPFTVYTPAELPAEIRDRAIENVRDLLSNSWDEADTEAVAAEIIAALGTALGTPGAGRDELTAVPGVKLDGWDVETRHESVLLTGTLTRENAPNLPWVDGLTSADLEAHRDFTRVWVNTENRGMYFHTQMDGPSTTMTTAVQDAIRTAGKAGHEEMEYKTSTEYATDYATDAEYEFHADGSIYRS